MNDNNVKTANLLVKSYIHFLIDSLYIEVDDENKGIANEMIKDGKLNNSAWKATVSLAPFFKEHDEIIRGTITDSNGEILPHSWIKFNLLDEEYILDPVLNIITLKNIYDKAFKTEEITRISTLKIKEDILTILDNSEKNEDNWHIINASNNINDSFYKSNMFIKGEKIKKKILTLTTHYNN